MIQSSISKGAFFLVVFQELSAEKTENDEVGDICAKTDYKSDDERKRLRTNSNLIEQAVCYLLIEILILIN